VAHRADVDAFIQEQHDKTEAEREALRQKDIKRRAASVVAWAPSEGELTLANDNFIRKIRDKAVTGSEVSAAAFDAILSPEPAVWAAFIETGIHAASARDKQIALDKEIAENRRLALEIQTRAEKTLVRPALVAAAKAALAGTPADVALFLRAGQFDALAQSIRSTTPKRAGWWVRSAVGDASLTSGDSAGAPPAPIADVTWKVVDGLAGEGCFSFESTQRPGHYLRPVGFRVQLQPSDGSTEFKNAATWCAKKGLGGPGVSLEAKAQPGRYLRHLGAELWIADNSGANASDRACGFNENATWLIDAPGPQTAPKPAPVKDPCSDVASFYDYSNADTGLWLFNGVGGGTVSTKLAWRPGAGQWDANRAKPVAGDFNGDGKLDIGAFYDNGGNTTALWLFDNVRGPAAPRKVWETGVGHWALSSSTPLAGDFDGDGKDDIAVFYNYGGGHTRLFLFDRVSTPGSEPYNHVTWDSGAGQWDPNRAKPVAGDFNGDGKLDIGAFYDNGGNTTALWLFDNVRGPAAPRKVWETGVGHWALSSSTPLAGDFDGDGKDDIAVFYNYGGGHTRLFLFDRVSTPGSEPYNHVTWDSGAGQWDPNRAKPVAGDFNGDGRTDLAAFYSYPDDQTRLWAFDAVSSTNAAPRAAWDSGPGNWAWGRGRPVS
ncbi:AbfB domain-containing protein, partial [Actinoplanes sp. NPDC051470]|uniref:AbfB domain-containing protein n=1 Tax=Actinoplanes sp. NPDC051470 TaxID=3157224 RepID=UPI00343CB9D0